MKRQIKSLMSLYCVVTLSISGCTEPASTIESGEAEIKEVTEQTQTATETLKPLNCPVILNVTHKDKDRYTEHPWVKISFIDNPNFDASLGDACKGDMKNVWKDLKRFDVNAQTYRVQLGFYGNPDIIKLFPKTANDVKNFINETTQDYRLDYKLDQIDRSTALGKNQIRVEMSKYYQYSHRSYWLTEHAYIINNILSEADLNVKFWSSEKPSYCYDRYEMCSCYTQFELCKLPENEREKISGQSYDFEHFPVWHYGELIFKKEDQDTQE